MNFNFLLFLKNNKSIFILILIIILILIGWKIFLRSTNDGIVEGYVIDSNGTPVEFATVYLREKVINLVKEPMKTKTDSTGYFIYHNIKMIEFTLSAKKKGVGISKTIWNHTYYKGQHYKLKTPLIIKKE